jgi:isoleucyl-tRNA synthetase
MSTKFTEYKGLDLPTVASEVFWKKENIFEKSVTTREGNEPSYFEGPPSANGFARYSPRNGTCYQRYFFAEQNSKGYQVKRVGWDTHGLPRIRY